MSESVTDPSWGESLAAVQRDLESARTLLAEARAQMEDVEARAKDAWRRKNAAADSRRLTVRTAHACGLTNTATMLAAIRRCDDRVDTATNEIHEIIESSKETCSSFERAWEAYRNARAAEIHILRLRSATEVIEPERQIDHKERLMPAQVRLEHALESQRREEKLRRSELALPDEEHYDPQYDDVELLQRKMRPWV
jgi:hypothetical protein